MVEVNYLKNDVNDEVVSVKNGVETILVVHKYEMVCVISTQIYIDNIPFVKYLHFCKDPSTGHNKMVHLIGKMCLKQANSKYFEKPILNEHMCNGLDGRVLSANDYGYLNEVLLDAEECFKAFCEKGSEE